MNHFLKRYLYIHIFAWYRKRSQRIHTQKEPKRGMRMGQERDFNFIWHSLLCED